MKSIYVDESGNEIELEFNEFVHTPFNSRLTKLRDIIDDEVKNIKEEKTHGSESMARKRICR
jgi:hypothetical protein